MTICAVWISGLQTTVGWFNMALTLIPSSTAVGQRACCPHSSAMVEAAAMPVLDIIPNVRLRWPLSSDCNWFPDSDALWLTTTPSHHPVFTSDVFLTFAKGTGPCIVAGSAYDLDKSTNAKALRVRWGNKLLGCVLCISN